ncbi:MAG TPA: glycosyltransferase [Gemmatimonadaceae bacterium]|nr:glycosyltransferase [Gemmatimonadaceae bacterium]
MTAPLKIVNVDLAAGPRAVGGLHGYDAAVVVLRWERRVLGRVRVPVRDGEIAVDVLWGAAVNETPHGLAAAALDAWLPPAPRPVLEPAPPPATCSVVICTRDRAQDLRACLASLGADGSARREIIVVDNAPSDDSTARVARDFPVTYVVEPRAGLNWARAAGARAATGELVLYTDDDVVMEPGWVDAMRAPFTEPSVAAVTGLVLPLELETEAQQLFELRYGGFARGFVRREFTAATLRPLAAGQVGAGASMAFRRSLLLAYRLFDVELDVGTAARSGGDTYAMYRLLAAGHRVVYTPEAVSWHRHRRTMEELRAQLHGYGVGTYVVFLRCLLQHGEWGAVEAGTYWLRKYHLKQVWRALRGKRDALPLELAWAELRGCLAAPAAYRATRRRERALHRAVGRAPERALPQPASVDA